METFLCSSQNHILEDPFLLGCFHTYCKKCLDDFKTLQLGPDRVKGYVCGRCHFFTPEEVVRKSYYHVRILERQETVPCCNMCQETITTKCAYYCQDCEEYLCINCQLLHTKFPLFQAHKMMQVSVASIINSAQAGHEETCMKHNHEVTHACLPCQELICPKCFDEHEDHDVKDVVQAQQITRMLLNNRKDKLEQLLASMEADNKVVTKLKTSVQQQVQAKVAEAAKLRDLLIAQIHQEFDNFQHDAQQRCTDVTHNYDAFLQQTKKEMSVAKQGLAAIKTVGNAGGSLFVKSVWHNVVPNVESFLQSAEETQGHVTKISQYDVEYVQTSDTTSVESFLGELKLKETNISSNYCPKQRFLQNTRLSNTDLAKSIQSLNNNFHQYITCMLPQSIQPGQMTLLQNEILIPNQTAGQEEIYQVTLETLELAKADLHMDTEEAAQLGKVQLLTQDDFLVSSSQGLYILDARSLACKCTLLQGQFGDGIWVSSGHVVALEVGTHNLHCITLHQNSHLHMSEVHVLTDLPTFCAKDTVIASGSHFYIAFFKHNLIYHYNLENKSIRQLFIQNLSAHGMSPLQSSTPKPSYSGSIPAAQIRPQLCGLDNFSNLLFCDASENFVNNFFVFSLVKMTLHELSVPTSVSVKDVLLSKDHVWILEWNFNSAKQQVTGYKLKS